jgi:hypothetical protein
LLLTALALLTAACSEPGCPKPYVKLDNACRRCPDGSEPQRNLCISTDGGGVVEPVSEDDEDAETGDDSEPQEAGVEGARDAASSPSDSSVMSPAMDAATGAEASTSDPDGSSDDGAATTDASVTEAGPDSAADATAEAGPPCYADKDKDGVGAGSAVSCEGYGSDGGAGLSLVNNDCDDNNDKRSPSLSDVCGDNIDNDCDGTPDDESNNACGGPCTTQLAHQPGDKCTNGLLGACAREGTWQCQGTTVTVCNAPSAAGSPEVCGDGVDNDCDGSKDEADAIDATIWYEDCDGDGYSALTETLITSGVGTTRSCTTPAQRGSCSWTTKRPQAPQPSSGIAASNWDCDDSSGAYRPSASFGIPPEGKTRSDLNCDGVDEKYEYCLPSWDCARCAVDGEDSHRSALSGCQPGTNPGRPRLAANLPRTCIRIDRRTRS